VHAHGLRSANRLEELAFYFEAARRHSDRNFLVMPNAESNAGKLGGHNDVLLSKPTYWTYGRKAGQPLVEEHPKYGTVYRVGGPEDMMEVARRENTRHVEIPFYTAGKTWVRFAAWDVAGNGAMVQPVKLGTQGAGETR
jgi:hypothetical protein